MEPEDIIKGRIFTWSVLLTECFIGLIVMVFLANADPGTLSSAEMEKEPPEIQEMIRAEWRAAFSATSKANVAGPIYFVMITGLSLGVLGGHWRFRNAYGVILFVIAALTIAAPWLSPHKAVLEPNVLPIITAVLFALLHAAGGAIMLFFRPVKVFLHPRRMLFMTPPQA